MLYNLMRDDVMKKIIIIELIALSSILFGCMDYQIVLSGYVKDSSTKLPIPNAIVSDGKYGEGNFDYTDSTGYYSYVTYCEEHTIDIAAQGYKNIKKTMLTPLIQNSSSISMDFLLEKE